MFDARESYNLEREYHAVEVDGKLLGALQMVAVQNTAHTTDHDGLVDEHDSCRLRLGLDHHAE